MSTELQGYNTNHVILVGILLKSIINLTYNIFMKKTLFSLLLFSLTFFSFAQNTPTGSLYIEGAAQNEDNVTLFTERFTDEATASGYAIAERRGDAAHTFRYIINEITEVTDEETGTINVNEPEIKIVIINNSNREEILSFEYFFNDINEMYNYTQFLFQRAAISIPLPRKSDFVDISWQNKLFYLRVSFDYPITFYALQPDGLIGGIGVYEGEYSEPNRVSPEDNKVLAMPGATAGFEFQFLNFMSLELNLQFSMGDPRNNYFVNLAAGAEVKFPLKFFQHIVIVPYLSFMLPITVSEVFDEFSLFLTGGGIQAGTKGGKNGSFFIDAGFMFSLSKVKMHNPYGELFPEPPVISYNHYILKLAVGYKYGFINRKTGKLLINYY